MRWFLILSLLIYSLIEMLILRAFIRKKEKEALTSTAVSFVFVWAVLIASFLFDFAMPDFTFIFLIFFLLIHSYFGYDRKWYDKSKKFDRIAHVIGSFSSALFFYYFFSHFFLYGGSKAFRAFYVLLIGISIGVIYELTEFVSDLKHSKKMQRGLRDTDIDMVSDLIGSFGAAVFAFFIL
jgi:hypothetical protein